MDALALAEITLRGAAVGLAVLLSVVLLRFARCCIASRVGALFALGSAAYTIESSPALCPDGGVTAALLAFFAQQCVTFFWWFALAALDDDFEWRPWHWAPFGAITVLWAIFMLSTELANAAHTTAQLIMLGLALHVFWFALAERRHDLLEQRRHVRILFVVVVGLACVGSVLLELTAGSKELPQWVDTLHALELFIVSLAFSAFLLQPATPLIPSPPSQAPENPPEVSPADVYELGKLDALMRTGFYTRERLTITELAEELDIPEHRLRKLINQQLGFRNFTAFLNSHRLNDAKSVLADPTQARRQITQIAFDLGYGSITPFNRAFKADEGMTPTEYRRTALAEKAQQSSSTH